VTRRAWYEELPHLLMLKCGKSPPVRMVVRSIRCGAVLPLAGGGLNLSAVVSRMERETQHRLPFCVGTARTAASDLAMLVRRGHSTQ
jgi:hypothetical protein